MQETDLIKAAQTGNLGLAIQLINSIEHPDFQDENGRTALMEASIRGLDRLVRALLDKGANINLADKQGYTALMLAVEYDRATLVDYLLSRGADVTAKMIFGQDALKSSLHSGNAAIVESLLNAGADPNMRYYNGKSSFYTTCLIGAVGYGFSDIVRLLLDRGANVNEQLVNGIFALGLVISDDHADLVKMLLEKGASTTLKDSSGRTPMQIAVARDAQQIIALLKAAGAAEETVVESKQEGTRQPKFTATARQAVFYAQEEAGRSGTTEVLPEHLLLGLLRMNNSAAARVLVQMGISLEKVSDQIKGLIVPRSGPLYEGMKLTPSAQKVVELAYDEADQLEHDYLGTEHLLLGLIAEGGEVSRVLTESGMTLRRTRQAIQIVESDPGAGPST